MTTEHLRLKAQENGTNWKKFGPYLAERQWGTVREDYSEYGAAWDSFTHDESRSRVYRWGEDGLMGFSDEKQKLCFALAFWNGNDGILKERLFGLTGKEGNHSEDVKEYYYYLDATPSHSYMKMRYLYPQNAFPYAQLVSENGKRNKLNPEYELIDTGIFDNNAFYTIDVEYIKNTPDDILIKVTIKNESKNKTKLTFLPTLWFRNTWNWGENNYTPHLDLEEATIVAHHQDLGKYYLHSEFTTSSLFTENQTNATRLYGLTSQTPFVKDAFHEYVIDGRKEAVNPEKKGTKAAYKVDLDFDELETKTLRFRFSNDKNLCNSREGLTPFTDFESIATFRKSETDEFYAHIFENDAAKETKRMAMAGMLWGKQYYEFDVKKWINGDSNQFPPPESRKNGRNSAWLHVKNHDIISMPDKWEYPWFAAWDSAFHCIAIAKADPFFAKQQLLMFLESRYMSDFGQIPAYECFNNIKDVAFLKQAFSGLEKNFLWWLNTQKRKDKMIFGGGFLGLDNVAVIDRGRPLPEGFWLKQVDGTAWMARFALDMMQISLELAKTNPEFEEKSTYFLRVFLEISFNLNHPTIGLWNEKTGFYHDKINNTTNQFQFLDHKNLVGLLPLIASANIDIEQHSYFEKYIETYLQENPQYQPFVKETTKNKLYFSVIPEERFFKITSAFFNPNEFWGKYGIRSLSKQYDKKPFAITLFGQNYTMKYQPNESDTTSFGENSNWRGPVWMPTNYVLAKSLPIHAQYFGKEIGTKAIELAQNLKSIFEKNDVGNLPVYADSSIAENQILNKIPLFYEFFNPETGKGCGASHQTGWTGLIVDL
ncbi:MAG: glucosidase [Bacteroidetes bacterium]|nr:MAG: glucosidase [Bacteroidota bacterium]